MADHDHNAEQQIMLAPRPALAQKGRGAVTNLQGRHELHERVSFDDGWAQEAGPPAWKTQVSEETAKTILSRNASPDIPFSVSLNPYRGCEHVMWSRS